ncbi:PAS domain S-box protein [Christiangramia aquimixticola]|uniref:PAS domain S-box protein n=1 Tax=Christiangramia aquimixticola TaxID=1697558 RepID=UPI003AA85AD5
MNITEFEKQRLDILKNINIHDSKIEQELNEITSLAARICNSPIALISFCDGQKHHIKANVGFNKKELPRDKSLCSLVLEAEERSVIIPDLQGDKEYAWHPFVNEYQKIGFYAGMALQSKEGYAVGTLCVMDYAPKTLSPIQLSALKNLNVEASFILQKELDKNGSLNLKENISSPDPSIPNNNIKAASEKADIFQHMFKFSLIPTFIYDLDLNILEANDCALDEFGYSREELQNIKIAALHPEKQLDNSLLILDNLPLLNTISITTEFKRKDGSVFTAEATPCKFMLGNKPLIHVFIKNISCRVKMEKENASLAQILQRSLNEIYIFDVKTLKFNYVNRGALHNLGYSMEDVRELTPLDLKPEFTPEKFQDIITPLRSGEKELVIFNTVHKRKDGSLYNVEVHLQKMEFKGKEVFTAIIIDTTLKTKSALQLKELNEKIVKANSRLKYFAASTAHDLQEPLRMISSFSNLLQTRYETELDEKAQKYLYYIVDGSTRMKKLIENILEYTEVEAEDFKKTPVNVNLVWEQVLEDLTAVIVAKKALIRLPHAEISIPSDKDLLYRIFLNLIGNGLKYLPEGRIPEINITAEEHTDSWKFIITDNGIGIKKEYHKKIFDLFTRLHSKSEYRGTGMGLAIVHRIVSLHKGEIWVESEPDKGSTFYLMFPK